MSYKYYIYGMHIVSDICMEEAYEDKSEENTDVVIELVDAMPQEVTDADKQDKSEVAVLRRQDAMWFRIPNVAEYLVEKDKIRVLAFTDETSQPVRTFLLGSAFGYCMILRKLPLLHGGAVEKDGKGIIVTGDCGAGKSTVTSALRELGYRFVADDTCAIVDRGDKVHINLAYPQQKLCRDAAIRQGFALDELIYIDEDRDKYAVRLKDGYLTDGVDFDYLFYIKIDDEENLRIRQLKGYEALMAVINNIYRGESGFAFWGVPPEYMKRCVTIASKIKIYEITRPSGKNTLEDIVSFVQKVVMEEIEE